MLGVGDRRRIDVGPEPLQDRQPARSRLLELQAVVAQRHVGRPLGVRAAEELDEGVGAREVGFERAW